LKDQQALSVKFTTCAVLLLINSVVQAMRSKIRPLLML